MSANGGFGSAGHLAVRFLGSLRPGGPPAADEAWAKSQLLPGERALWVRMSGADRRHAIGVARDALGRLEGAEAEAVGVVPRPVVAAALLHDVGKVEADLGTWARVAVTLIALGAGRNRVADWATGAEKWREAAGRYVTHDRIGAELLVAAGSDPLTAAWAREHHSPESSWTVPLQFGNALKAADGD